MITPVELLNKKVKIIKTFEKSSIVNYNFKEL